MGMLSSAAGTAVQLKNAYIQDLEKLTPELEALLTDKASLEEQLASLQLAHAGLQQQVAQHQEASQGHEASIAAHQQLQAELEELRAENTGLYDAAAASRQVCAAKCWPRSKLLA